MTQISKPPTGKNGTPPGQGQGERPERERAARAEAARNGEAAVAAEPRVRCLGAREPGGADRPVRHRAAVVRLRCTARDRAGGAGLGHRHHRAARRQVDAGPRRAARGVGDCRDARPGAGASSFLLVLLSTPVSLLARARQRGRRAACSRSCRSMNQPLAVLDEVRKALNAIGASVGSGQATLKVEQQSETMVTTIFSILTPAVSQFVLFIGALVFYLVYQQRLRSAVVYLLSDREARLAHAAHAQRHRRADDHLFRHVHHRERLPRAGDRGADLGGRAAQPAAVGRAGGRAQLCAVSSGRRSSPARWVSLDC